MMTHKIIDGQIRKIESKLESKVFLILNFGLNQMKIPTDCCALFSAAIQKIYS